MAFTQKISTGSFVEVQNDVFFRRDDGKICLSNPRNVIINCSKTDNVELICVSSVYENSVISSSEPIVWYFWKISNKIYPLTGTLSNKSFVELPDNTTFIGFYVSNIFLKSGVTVYVKYLVFNSYGILSFDNNSISNTISYQNEYAEIDYESGYFYATSKKGRRKYHILNPYGLLINSYTTSRKLLKNSAFSYDKNKIYTSRTSISVPGGINFVHIESDGNFEFIVVRNTTGIYYYSLKLEYLLGPIAFDLFQMQENFCYVSEIINRKFTKIFCIKYVKKNTYICASIECENGINYYTFKNLNFFFKNGTFYVLRLENMEFESLFSEKEANKFTFYENNNKKCVNIVCFKNNIPISIVIYDLTYNTIVSKNNLKVIGESYDKSMFICQLQLLDSPTLGISKDGKIIFSV